MERKSQWGKIGVWEGRTDGAGTEEGAVVVSSMLRKEWPQARDSSCFKTQSEAEQSYFVIRSRERIEV